MTAHPPNRTGPPGYRTPEPQVGSRKDFTPRWPAVGGTFVALALGLFAIFTGSGAVLSVFIAVSVLLLTAAPYVQPSGHQTPGYRAVTTGPAW